MDKYKFIITKNDRTRDFLKEQGFTEINAPKGMYMFLFNKMIFNFSNEKLNYSLTNTIMF